MIFFLKLLRFFFNYWIKGIILCKIFFLTFDVFCVFQVGLIGNKIDLCSIHRRVENLDSMMMTNLPPVMLPPITDYGMLTPTLGIKVSRFTPSVSAKKRVSRDTRYSQVGESILRSDKFIAYLSKRDLGDIKINIQILHMYGIVPILVTV